jgi:hypothetical protein
MKISDSQMRDKLIANGIRNMKEFGYPHVGQDNILTDEIYREFFKTMLESSKGYGTQTDRVIDGLLESIKY